MPKAFVNLRPCARASGEGEPTMKTFRLEVPLRWGDMDAMAHINNCSYFLLIDQSLIH